MGDCALEDCDHAISELKTHEVDENFHSMWWLVAKTYYHLDAKKKAKDCQKKAQKYLHQFSHKISDKKMRESFLSSDLIRKEIWLDLSKIDIPMMAGKITNDILKFCPSCGKSNENQNKFCSGCGQNLQKDS